jgi:hypothetical protein
MAVYQVDDLVDVRADKTLSWRAGTVTAVESERYKVTLDSAISADAWSGVTRKYSGSNTLTVVYILKNAEVVAEGELIRTQGG